MSNLRIEFTHVPSNQMVAFTAFLESFGDDYSAEWSSDKVFGRMDPTAQYKGTTRKINASFTVPAESLEHAFINHIKISKLLQMMYPNYESSPGIGIYTIAAPPLMRVRFNNLIKNQVDERSGLLGFIPSLKYDPNLDSNIFTINESTINLDKLKTYLIEGEGVPTDSTTIKLPGTGYYEDTIAFQSFKISFELNVLHTHALGYNIKNLSKDGKTIAPAIYKYPMGFDVLG